MATGNRRQPTLIVGASAAGLTTAESLRREGLDGRIVLIGDEARLPYDRPPLSKQHLTAPEATVVELTDARTLRDLDIEVELGCPATELDRKSRNVQLSDGRTYHYENLVIATGVRPRSLHRGHELAGVHTLRNSQDASRLRAALQTCSRVAVLGGGFLGAEVVASARTLGLEVTWLFPEQTPLADVVGIEVGRVFADRHLQEGVRITPGVTADHLAGVDDAVVGVIDQTGVIHPADLVVVCIGSIVNTEWLGTSGLSLTNGVDCDEYLRADDKIFAAGDIASWVHPFTGRRVRVEHRTNASEQAMVVAHNIVHGVVRTFTPIPYFWTDQYGDRLQVYGAPRGADHFVVSEGALSDRRFAGWWTVGDEVVAVGGVGLPRAVRKLRAMLAPA